MSLEKWDQRAKSLAHEVMEYEHKFKSSRTDTQIAVMEATLSLYRKEALLDDYFRRIRGTFTKDSAVPPRHKTIIKWSGELAKKMFDYYRVFNQASLQSMWLNLLRLRYCGSCNIPKQVLSEKEMVDICTRYGDLKQAERGLKKNLVQQQHEKSRLEREYHEQKTIETNCEAGASLRMTISQGKEGIGYNPVVRGLEAYLQRLTIPTRKSVSPEERRLQSLNQEVLKRAGSLLTGCRRRLSLSSGPAVSIPDSRETDEFRTRVAEINDLTSEIEFLENLLVNAPFHVRVPFRMKKY